MRFYDYSKQIFLDAYRKEDINDNMYMVSMEEEQAIQHTLANSGVVYIKDNTLKWSGAKPETFYDFDTETERWTLNVERRNSLLEKQRLQTWELIKERRLKNSYGGVYIASANKWFQSSPEEIEKYMVLNTTLSDVRKQLQATLTTEQLQAQGGMLVPWTAYDNTYIDMTPELLHQILVQLTFKTLMDHSCAAAHKAGLWQSTEPLGYDYSTGWQPNFGEIK